MKKICIVCPGAYALLVNKELATEGGAEVQLKTIGFELAEKGYDVSFIVNDYGQGEIDRVKNITIYKVGLKYMGGSNFYIVPAWLKLWSTLFKIRADIHLLKIPRDLVLPLGMFCKTMRKKLIFIGQMDSDVDPVFLKTQNLMVYWLFRLGMSLVDYAVAQNETQRQGFEKLYMKKARIIKNILTLPHLEDVKKNGYILWVGNSLPKKQPEKLLELAKKLPRYQFKMIMSLTAQNPDDSFVRDKLDSIPNLDYLGFVPFPHIAKYFQGASLFVSTSFKEGFPNTFLQSWQYCTPVVSLHVNPDGVIEKYQLGRHSCGFEKFCDDIRELMENERLRKKIGKNAIKYVYKNHSQDIIIPKYLELFKEILS